MLSVDVGAYAAIALSLGHDVHGQGGFAGGLGAEDLGDAALGQAPDTESEVESQRTGGDGLDGETGALAHTHDGTLAVGLLDLTEGEIEGLLTLCAHDGCCSLFAVAMMPVDGDERDYERRERGWLGGEPSTWDIMTEGYDKKTSV